MNQWIRPLIAVSAMAICVMMVVNHLTAPPSDPIDPSPRRVQPSSKRVEPSSSSSASRGRDVISRAMSMRMVGRFDDAIALLRSDYERTHDIEDMRQCLGIVEDTGNAAALVSEARAILQHHPEDPYVLWMLARGLLFSAASQPADEANAGRLREAEKIADILDKAAYTPREEAGGVAILRLQICFLQRKWQEADAYAQRALELGATSGESADILSVRFFVALQMGDLARARERLLKLQETVQGYTQPAYYLLRGYREELLVVRWVFFLEPFTAEDIDRLEATHRELRKLDMVDPTLPLDAEVTASLQAMRMYLELVKKGDFQGQLSMVEKGMQEPRTWKARCFYSEAVEKPFKPYYMNILAGDLCVKLSRPQEARRYYQAALQYFPDNKVAEKRLQAVQ